MSNDEKDTKKAPDGEKLAEEIRELKDENDTPPEVGRARPGDASAGATGPGGNA